MVTSSTVRIAIRCEIRLKILHVRAYSMYTLPAAATVSHKSHGDDLDDYERGRCVCVIIGDINRIF